MREQTTDEGLRLSAPPQPSRLTHLLLPRGEKVVPTPSLPHNSRTPRNVDRDYGQRAQQHAADDEEARGQPRN